MDFIGLLFVACMLSLVVAQLIEVTGSRKGVARRLTVYRPEPPVYSALWPRSRRRSRLSSRKGADDPVAAQLRSLKVLNARQALQLAGVDPAPSMVGSSSTSRVGTDCDS
jgi:hypothetical protein